MADCISVFCGARSSTDTIRSHKDLPTERLKPVIQENESDSNSEGNRTSQKEQSSSADLRNSRETITQTLPGPISNEALQNDWKEMKEKQYRLEKEMKIQQELKEKQVEKLRHLKMALEDVHRRQSYHEKSDRIAQDGLNTQNFNQVDHHLQQHPSLQNLHPQHLGANQQHGCQLQQPDLLPQHKSLPQVHQNIITPLPSPTDAIHLMRQQHFQRLQQMQQQIRQQHQQCMQMMPPLLPPLQPMMEPLQPHQMHMKHLEHMQHMQQQLTQLQSISHDSLLRKARGVDLTKPHHSHSQVLIHNSEHNFIQQNQGEVLSKSSSTSYSMNHTSGNEPHQNIENLGASGLSFEHSHAHSQSPSYHGCYSNVDLSNRFPVTVDNKQRPYSVYEGFFTDPHNPNQWSEDPRLSQTHSSSDLDIPSLDESDIGSLSELLGAAQSSSNLSTSDATELRFSDSEDSRSHYDDLPHDEIVMDDEMCVRNDFLNKGPYVRRISCPDVFNDQACSHGFNSDFSCSSDYSEDNTSEVTDTYSQSLESSCAEEASEVDLNETDHSHNSQVVPEISPDEYIDDINENHSYGVKNGKGEWSELSKSAISALLEEIDDISNEGGEDDSSIGSMLDNYQDEIEQNSDVVLEVDVVTDSDCDVDVDNSGSKEVKSDDLNNMECPESKYDSVSELVEEEEDEDDDDDEDDDQTLTGDSCTEDCDTDVMKKVMLNDGKKGNENPQPVGLLSPVMKRRGMCGLQESSRLSDFSLDMNTEAIYSQIGEDHTISGPQGTKLGSKTFENKFTEAIYSPVIKRRGPSESQDNKATSPENCKDTRPEEIYSPVIKRHGNCEIDRKDSKVVENTVAEIRKEAIYSPVFKRKGVCAPENKEEALSGAGNTAGCEAIYSPVVKRRGICKTQLGSSQTSLSSVSHPKTATVLQQKQPFNAKKTTWAMSCLRPCPPIRPANFAKDDATKSPRIGRKSSVNRRKPVEDVKTLEDDAHLLKVIEAYCTSAKTRQTVNSSLLDPPQMLIAEEEKIIIEEMKGNQTVVEEKTLVDTVYSLKDQVKELKSDQKRLRKDLEDERRARKRLEGLLRKSLRSIVETTWEEGAPNS